MDTADTAPAPLAAADTPPWVVEAARPTPPQAPRRPARAARRRPALSAEASRRLDIFVAVLTLMATLGALSGAGTSTSNSRELLPVMIAAPSR